MDKSSVLGPIAAALLALIVLTACANTLPGRAAGSPASDATPVVTAAAATEVAPATEELALLPPAAPPFSTSSWRTDFTRRTVAWDEILSGGPPKDGIPAVDAPTFESVALASDWLSARDPVIVFSQGDDVRAYPLAILIWHEIVNDVVADKPVAVTFCPLCNASIVFDATVDGQTMDFGTTGKLRNSDLIMYDRQTESWWQQFTGQAIVGELTGSQLSFLPSQVLSFADVQVQFPDAQVLARPPVARQYGANPYSGYDSTAGRPFLFSGKLDARLPATARIVGVETAGAVMAYSFSMLSDTGAVNDVLGDTPVVIFHKAGTASALDDRVIAEGKDVGSVGVFDRTVDGRALTFQANGDGTFTDAETGSTWNILGQAVAGELTGAQLRQLIAFDHFWFAWSAFFPETGLYAGEE